MVYRVDNGTQAATEPPKAAAGTGGYFTNGNPIGPVPATVVDQDFMNMLQEELVTVVTAAGLQISKGNNSQVLEALQHMFQPGGGSYINNGGIGSQGGHVIDIGWTATSLLQCTVDTTNLGPFAFQNWVSSNYASLTFVEQTYPTTLFCNQTYATNAYVNSTFATNAYVNSTFATDLYVGETFMPQAGGIFTGSVGMTSGNIDIVNGYLICGSQTNPVAAQARGVSLVSGGGISSYSDIQPAGAFGTGGYETTQVTFSFGGNVLGSVSTTDGTSAIYGSTSDYRVKEDVKPVVDATALLGKLRPVRFKYANAQNSNEHIGFLAHEAQDVLPQIVHGEKDAVSTDGKPILQQVDYGKLTPLLCAALLESNARITALEAKIATMEQPK